MAAPRCRDVVPRPRLRLPKPTNLPVVIGAVVAAAVAVAGLVYVVSSDDSSSTGIGAGAVDADGTDRGSGAGSSPDAAGGSIAPSASAPVTSATSAPTTSSSTTSSSTTSTTSTTAPLVVPPADDDDDGGGSFMPPVTTRRTQPVATTTPRPAVDDDHAAAELDAGDGPHWHDDALDDLATGHDHDRPAGDVDVDQHHQHDLDDDDHDHDGATAAAGARGARRLVPRCRRPLRHRLDLVRARCGRRGATSCVDGDDERRCIVIFERRLRRGADSAAPTDCSNRLVAIDGRTRESTPSEPFCIGQLVTTTERDDHGATTERATGDRRRPGDDLRHPLPRRAATSRSTPPGMLMSASGDRVTAVGDRFDVRMDRESLQDIPLGEYEVTVVIARFEPDRAIAWSIDGVAQPPIGHVYGYELEPIDGGTMVTSYYDWSNLHEAYRAVADICSR